MKKIDVRELQDNLVRMIGDEWMLVTAGTKEKFNTMTANWGGMGYLWNKPVAFVFIRPERYTYEFVEQQDMFTLAFLGEANKGMHKICGTTSGRDTDKVKETGLIPLETENGSISFEQARVTIECRKLYTNMIKEENFLSSEEFPKWYTTKGNPHKMYIVEVLNVWVNE